MELEKLTPVWTSVVTGSTLYEPLLTEYGFVMASSGRQILACTKDGSLIWQKTLPGTLLMNISVNEQQFIVAIVRDYKVPNRVCLINPSGSLVWQKPVSQKIIAPPLYTKNNIFLACNDSVVCMTMGGMIRYVVSTRKQNAAMPLVELNDGSILVMLDELKERKTVAIRLDCYGNVIEEITFSGLVTAMYDTGKDGVLLAFAEGSLALVNVTNYLLQSVWVIANVTSPNATVKFFRTSDNSICLLHGKPTHFAKIDTKKQLVATSFDIPELSTNEIVRLQGYKTDFFVASKKNVVIYSTNGKRLSYANLPKDTRKWQYVFSTQRGIVAITKNDWTINAYKLYRTNKDNSSTAYIAPVSKIYKRPVQKAASPLNSAGFISKETRVQMQKALTQDVTKKDSALLTQKGYEWQENIIQELYEIHTAFLPKIEAAPQKEEASYYQMHIDYSVEIIQLALLWQDTSMTALVASILQDSADTTLLKLITDSIKTGFDPQGELLDALASLVFSFRYTKDRALMTNIANAVLEICIYNGKPTFITKGKKVFSALATSPYDSPVNAAARECLKKVH